MGLINLESAKFESTGSGAHKIHLFRLCEHIIHSFKLEDRFEFPKRFMLLN